MVYGIPLYWYLIVSAALFCIGLYGVMARKNAIAVLMGVEGGGHGPARHR